MFDIITMHMELFAEEIMSKIYVEVEAVFGENGTLRPNCVHWKDGRKFVIDKITDIRRAASLKGGGCGMRYTCVIMGKKSFLFYGDEGRWFVEGKDEADPRTRI